MKITASTNPVTANTRPASDAMRSGKIEKLVNMLSQSRSRRVTV